MSQQHKLNSWTDLSSSFVTMGDYAGEIENAVGEEIYSPIFKAGIFLFASGIVSAIATAFIVSKSNSWESLEEEFEKGKVAQLDIFPGTDSSQTQKVISPLEKSSQSIDDANSSVDDAGGFDL